MTGFLIYATVQNPPPKSKPRTTSLTNSRKRKWLSIGCVSGTWICVHRRHKIIMSKNLLFLLVHRWTSMPLRTRKLSTRSHQSQLFLHYKRTQSRKWLRVTIRMFMPTMMMMMRRTPMIPPTTMLPTTVLCHHRYHCLRQPRQSTSRLYPPATPPFLSLR